MSAAAIGAQGEPSARRAELARRLDAVRARIAAACAAVARDPGAITLVAVTKFFPPVDLAHLAALGVTDVGESRDQDAAGKLADLAAFDPGARAALRVHFVGQVQTNKAASITRYADVVHSVDRPRLVDALAKGAARAGRRLDVLIQVDLQEAVAGGGDDAGTRARRARGGVPPDGVAALAECVAATDTLRLAGLMAVAPLGGDPEEAFARLHDLHGCLLAGHPQASVLSAGMSDDLEAAVAHGATHLRVGTAILGSRPPDR